MLLKRLTLWTMLVLAAPLAFAAPTDFYRALLVRGTSNFEYGNFVLAERELRIAAFGLLEDAAAYQTAQVYLALVQLRLGQKDDATKALNLLLQAEKVQPGYRVLPLPASVRSAFEKEVPSMLTAEQLATFPDLFPVPTTASSRVAPVDEIKNLESMAKKNPESIPIRAALAEAKFNAGDYRSARKLAESVLEKEPGNATALSVLGRISAQAGRYDDAAKNLSAVSAARALGADETAALFVASVETNDLVTAERLAPTLSAPVITRPDVARAFKKMTSARPKVADVSTQENPESAGPPPVPVRPEPPREPVRQAEPVAATPAPVRVPNESESVVDLLAEASRVWASGNSARAVSIYKRLAEQKDVDRWTLLSIAMGMAQAGAFAESTDAYRRAGRLRSGEEIHLFYKAVNYYHAGDFRLAREYLRLALPKITMTAEVADYKVRIEATP